MSTEGMRDMEKNDGAATPSETSEIDLYSFHEQNAGRLVIDPAEAKVEFGEAFASRLKLSRDGTKVLWPQPTDSPDDPQNWSDRRKSLLLIIVTLVRVQARRAVELDAHGIPMKAAIVPDFDSGIGIAAIFKLAEQYNTNPGVINNLTSNWSIFLLGWGGLTAVMVIRRIGRLPVLFWSQLLALGFLVGATFAPNLKTFTAMRCLTAFFGTAPQVTGLYIVTDLYPFHMQARMLNFWTMGFIISPFLSPFAFGFLVARTTWRWAYGIGSMYGAIVVLLIVFFMEETMYDRTVKPIPERPTTGLRYRIESLVGLTGLKMQKYRISWSEAIISPLNVVWRPHILGILVFEALLFGFGIGINVGVLLHLQTFDNIFIQVTNAVFLGSPPPVGFAWSPFAIAGGYGTPIVSVIIGELIGRYMNDWIMNWSIRRNNGVFEAESRLWACYVAVPLYIIGFVVLGAAFQNHLSPGAIVMGWGIAETSIMINTVAVYAYCNDSFPKHQGEVSALINLARTLGGFAVAYFQVPWAQKHGALQVFGCEAAIVAGLFLLVVPALQLKGRELRKRFSLH
ncbi:major facilitator superfamily domain-containing protein [Mycena pura]|uniref:Major facilitator superfamily domain-containing protein n=1 Tax=Mycena pura TaxID=153505 RepID=A0AAD6Y864_9AGAR|nr:major facilitator superfamily domain-containing protein [Mycena pura]